MENINYLLFNLGFCIVFAFLGASMILLHMPKDSEFKNYRIARYTLGLGFVIMALYCLIRLLTPANHEQYQDFWLNIIVALTFSWLNYATFLFLLDTPRYKIKHFFIDGIIPITIMVILGIIGMFIENMQHIIVHLFCATFALKCIYMFWECEKEWKTCKKELENFYGIYPDIRWIRSMIWITLILSICTVISYYFPDIHIVFDFVAPLLYVYMVFKIVNFAPKKIDAIRGNNLTVESRHKEKKIKKDIIDIIAPKLEEWVSEKKFCEAELTIKDVAMDMGTNHNYLSQYLNNSLGMTFQVWLNTLRIEESKNILISEKNISIEEVGIRVGIPQSYNFSRWFKTITAHTPYQYRKLHSKI